MHLTGGHLTAPAQRDAPSGAHPRPHMVRLFFALFGREVCMNKAPKMLGSLIVALWLLGIAFNLLLTGQYYDVAVRDTVMAIGAFSLYMLSGRREA